MNVNIFKESYCNTSMQSRKMIENNSVLIHIFEGCLCLLILLTKYRLEMINIVKFVILVHSLYLKRRRDKTFLK